MPSFIQRRAVVQHCAGTEATVALIPLAGCEGCERQRRAGFGRGHCGIDFFGLSASKHRTTLKVFLSEQQAAQLEPGCEVDVEIPAPDGRWLALCFQVYGYPTLGLFIGAVLGSVFGELTSVAFSLAGLCAGLWLGRRFVRIPQSTASLSGPRGPVTRIVAIDR